MPLLAVLTAGVISGLAGGMIRDVLLGLEAAAIAHWYYIPAVVLAALAGGFLAHRLIQGHVSYLLARGLAAGLLVTIGVQKGIEYQAPADAAIFLGILAGTMGGATADTTGTARRGAVSVRATPEWDDNLFVSHDPAVASRIHGCGPGVLVS